MGLARRSIISLIGFLLLWQGLVLTKSIPQTYLPGVPAILSAAVAQVFDKAFWSNEGMTLVRALGGLACAIVTALAVAVTGALYPVVQRAFAPFMQLFVSLPPAALVPLSIFALGLGPALFLFITWFACVGTIYLSTANALRASEPVQIHVARALGYGRWETLQHVRLPSAVPEIMTGIRIAAAASLLATVAAEMLAGSNGMGFMLYDSAFSMRTPDMFALLGIAGVNGILLNAAVVAIRRVVAGWHEELASTAQGV